MSVSLTVARCRADAARDLAEATSASRRTRSASSSSCATSGQACCVAVPNGSDCHRGAEDPTGVPFIGALFIGALFIGMLPIGVPFIADMRPSTDPRHEESEHERDGHRR